MSFKVAAIVDPSVLFQWMNAMSSPLNHLSFEFTLMRRQLVDRAGTPVDSNNPEHWTLEDELLDSNAPPEVVRLGRGRMTVVAADESAFVRERLFSEPEPGCQYIRALLVMHEPNAPAPAMDHLVVVALPGAALIVYEVIVAASDLKLPPEHSYGAGAQVMVSLPEDHAVLRLRPDLSLDDSESSRSGGSDAQH